MSMPEDEKKMEKSVGVIDRDAATTTDDEAAAAAVKNNNNNNNSPNDDNKDTAAADPESPIMSGLPLIGITTALYVAIFLVALDINILCAFSESWSPLSPPFAPSRRFPF
jgi:hypothetical protein